MAKNCVSTSGAAGRVGRRRTGILRRGGIAVVLVLTAAVVQTASATTSTRRAPQYRAALPTSVTMAIDKLAPTLDRQITSSGPDITYNVLETPLQLNSKGQIVSYLAQTYKVLDANTLELKFRKGITFTDGTPFNAQVFKVNMDRILSPQSTTLAPLYASVSSVKVTGPYNAEIIHTPDATLLPNLAWYAPMVSAKQIQDSPGTIATDPIGTGPYVISNNQPGIEVDMTANPKWWGKKLYGAPKIKTARLVLVTDPAVRLSEIQSGQAQIAWNLDPSAISQLKRSQLNVRLGTEVYDLRFGLNDPLTLDANVRKAISLVIKRSDLRPLYEGYAVAETQPWPSFVNGYTKRKAPPYDPAQAKSLIQQAGDTGKTIDMWVSSAYKPGIGLVAQVIAAQIDTTGLKVQLHDIDRNSFKVVQRTTGKGASPLVWDSVGFEDHQAADFLVRLAECGGAFATWCDPTVDALAKKAAAVTNGAKLAPLLQQFEDIQDSYIPYIPIISPTLIDGKASNLHYDYRGQALPLIDMHYTGS